MLSLNLCFIKISSTDANDGVKLVFSALISNLLRATFSVCCIGNQASSSQGLSRNWFSPDPQAINEQVPERLKLRIPLLAMALGDSDELSAMRAVRNQWNLSLAEERP